MNLFVAASCDTKSKEGAYAFRVENFKILTGKHFNTTTPRELLIGLKNLFDYMTQNGFGNRGLSHTLFTNNEYIINMLNENKIEEWKNSSWVKSNGEEVSNKDVMPALYQFLMFFKQQGVTIFATKPTTPEEIAIFNATAKAALARRKE